MATQAEINQLIGRAMLESDFRARLLKAPAETAKEAGIALSKSEAEHIGKIDPGGLDGVAAQFLKVTDWGDMRMWPLW